MSGEVDAAGTLAAGSLVAGQFDRAGAGRAGEVASTCANCGAPIDGNFCGNCGQTAHVARSIGHIFHDLLHGLLHFDSKGWRTLPMLVFRPGRLTREYVEGKRARYIAPFAMFLFTVFLMYFTFAFIGGPALDANGTLVQIDAEGIVDLKAEIAEAEARIAALEAEQRTIAAKPDKAPGEGAGLAGEITGQRAVLAAMRAGLRSAEQNSASNGADDPATNGRAVGWSKQLIDAMRAGNVDINLGNAALNERFRKALDNPDLLFYKMQQSAYKFSFLLVPISLPFVWLLFPFRRRTHLYDHAVFTLYSLSFVSLLFVFAAVLSSAGAISLTTALALCFWLPPIHMYAQLKGAYGLGLVGALVRTVLLGTFAMIVLSLFLVAVIALGVA